MTFLERYRTDPHFRLQRLMILRSRLYRRRGGPFTNDRAYDREIDRAISDIRAMKKETGK